MEEQTNKTNIWIRILKCAVALLIAVLLCAWLEGLFRLADVKDVMGALSDCFVVPGVLFAGIGGLSWISAKGGYDSMGYMINNFALHSLIPSKFPKSYKSLYEYKEEKDKKGRHWMPSLLLTGLFSIFVGAVFLAIYSAM